MLVMVAVMALIKLASFIDDESTAMQSVTLPRGIVELAVSTSHLFRFGPYIALPRVVGQQVLTIWSSF